MKSYFKYTPSVPGKLSGNCIVDFTYVVNAILSDMDQLGFRENACRFFTPDNNYIDISAEEGGKEAYEAYLAFLEERDKRLTKGHEQLEPDEYKKWQDAWEHVGQAMRLLREERDK